MDGLTVRKLLRHATTATLATLDAATGHPYASLVEMATMPDAQPILLLSGLARHTRNLNSDARASLLVDQRHVGDRPLATERATIIGRATATSDTTARRRYLARHPTAEQFAAFGDFGFWLLDIDKAHGIAGFGRIREVPGAEVILPGHVTAPIAAIEPAIIERVNVRLAAWCRANGHPLCIATGVDPEGIDLRSPSGPVRTPIDLRRVEIEKLVEAIVYGITSRPRGRPA